MIQVDNLSKFFGPIMAVDRISFAVGQGEIVGFLGLNGAGKSTTMRILTTYMPATSGIAKVAGYDVMLQSTRPPEHRLSPRKRAALSRNARRGIRRLPGQAQGVPRVERNRRIEYCLERAGWSACAAGCFPRCRRAIASASAWQMP